MFKERYLSVAEKFKFLVEPVTESGCWLWLGAIEPQGYAVVNGVNNKRIKMHRYSYQQYKGEIPEGMCICHTCDVRSCVNPDHLFLGSWNDNIQDKVLKKRHAHGVTHARAKLTEKDVLDIRAANQGYKTLAKMYDVDSTTIRDIKLKRTWAHIA